jgi:arylsulfatase A-like enzyme
VPILLGGFGIKRGINNETVHVADIASTLCRLLGIELPTGNVGHPLAKALKSE